MNKVLYFFSFVLLTSLIACKGSGKAGDEPNSDAAHSFPYNEVKGGYTESLESIRNQCLSMIQFRKESEAKPYSFLTTGYWHPEFIFNKGAISAEFAYAGYWVQYGDDFKYKYGIYEEVVGGGDYHYSLNREVMIMVDKVSDIEPKIWKVQYNGDHLVLVGTHEFGINNGMQIKNVPMEKIPPKPVM